MKVTSADDPDLAIWQEYREFRDHGESLLARFQQMGHKVPDPLLRMFGEASPGNRPEPYSLSPPPLPAPPPKGYLQDHIYVPIEKAQVRALVLGILGEAGDPLPVKTVRARVHAYRGEVSDGSIANIGTALANSKTIDRGEKGWRLLTPDSVPVIANGYLWGPRDVFGPYEAAWWRRYVILHLIRLMPGGLQAQQITDHLNALDWVCVPKDKDAIKADLVSLSGAKLIRRSSNSRKYVPTSKEGAS